ncbi:MAG: SDR family oxidoreductase [Candidatus Omnitrophica bacterium]|nr:SDR family oxidoreductase [Candidatus Omnitrophota bacterium]
MARYLVTGGAGFIGSHIAERLVREGHAVRVLDDLSSGRLENLEPVRSHVEFVQGDIRDPEPVRRAMQGIEYVIHEAAWRSVPKSMSDPAGYTDVNILGLVRVLEAAKAAGVRRLVLASSSSVYGNTERLPSTEQQPTEPISPYALSKLCGEQFCRLFSRSFGLDAVSVRYFNVFGPRQGLDNDYAVVIPKFIACVLQGESPPVYGDGQQSRDFTFIENVVTGTIRASVAPGAGGGVFNIACGETHSVLDVLQALNALFGTDVAPTHLPARVGDVRRTRADISLARRVLHWEPTVTFADGLRQTAAWFKAKHDAGTGTLSRSPG